MGEDFNFFNLPFLENSGSVSLTGIPLNSQLELLLNTMSIINKYGKPKSKPQIGINNTDANAYIESQLPYGEHNANVKTALGQDLSEVGLEIFKDENSNAFGLLDMRYAPTEGYKPSKFSLFKDKISLKAKSTVEGFKKWNTMDAQSLQIANTGTQVADFITNSGILGRVDELSKASKTVNGINSFVQNTPLKGTVIGTGLQIGTSAFNMVDTAFGKKMKNLQVDLSGISTSGSDFGGSLSNAQEAIGKYSGKRLGLTGIHSGNKALNKAESLLNKIYSVNSQSELRNDIAEGGLDLAMENRKLALQGTNYLNGIMAAKQGGILEIKEIPCWEFIEPELEEEIEMFKEGGSIIVNGALHARKHNIELDNITKKGVPVISEENGEIIQQAEVEGGEIVFSKSITDELEKQYKVYYNEESKPKEKNEACLKIGKLLVDEILNNTTDNTGLI